jgi:hypothetical protein
MATLMFKNVGWQEPFRAQQIAAIVSAGSFGIKQCRGYARATYARALIDEWRGESDLRQRRLVYLRSDDPSFHLQSVQR